jgi:two-component system response regulator (stage 0 sporulation protein F)
MTIWEEEVVYMSGGKSILLVDNDQEFCRAVKKLLEKSGYYVAMASDGREALDILSEDTFHLIISGLRMPNLDGTELMEEINRRKISVPVIFITAYGNVESYLQVMNMGAYDYLNKPVKGQEILRVARRALGVSDSPHHAFCS